MNTTHCPIIASPVGFRKLSLAVALLPQVASRLGKRAPAVGKAAYEFLSAVRSKAAPEVADVLAQLGLPSIRHRRSGNPTEAALAIAAAALLDGARGRRLTGVEKIDEALNLLDDQLQAGW